VFKLASLKAVDSGVKLANTGNCFALYTISRAQLYGDAFGYLGNAPPNVTFALQVIVISLRDPVSQGDSKLLHCLLISTSFIPWPERSLCPSDLCTILSYMVMPLGT